MRKSYKYGETQLESKDFGVVQSEPIKAEGSNSSHTGFLGCASQNSPHRDSLRTLNDPTALSNRPQKAWFQNLNDSSWFLFFVQGWETDLWLWLFGSMHFIYTDMFVENAFKTMLYLNQVVVRSIELLVKLNYQALEERWELPLLLTGLQIEMA